MNTTISISTLNVPGLLNVMADHQSRAALLLVEYLFYLLAADRSTRMKQNGRPKKVPLLEVVMKNTVSSRNIIDE